MATGMGDTHDIPFEKELVRRFFNSRSYFFLCLSEHLKEKLPPDKPGADENYALVAALLDRLQSAEDPRVELERMEKVEQFRRYNAVLDRQVQEFKTQAMSPEQLKLAIEEIAAEFLQAVLGALSSEESKRFLLEYLGVEVEPEAGAPPIPDVAFVKERLTPEPSPAGTYEEEFLQRHFRSIVSDQFAEVENEKGEDDPQARLQQLLEVFSAVRDAAMIHGEEDVEILCFKTTELIRRALAEKAPKTAVLEVAKRVEHYVRTHVSPGDRDEDEIRVLVGMLQDALGGQFPKVPAAPGTLASKPRTEPPTEVVSTDGEELPAAEPIEETDRAQDELSGALEQQSEPEPERTDAQEVLEAGETEAGVLRPEEMDFERLVGVEDFLQFDEEQSSFEAPYGPEVSEDHSGDNGSVSAHWPPAEVDAEPSAGEQEEVFKLPGEDDEELRALIQEVREHSWKVKQTLGQSGGEKQGRDERPKSVTSAHKPEEGTDESTKDSYGHHQADADLYLGVVRRSLEALKSNPGDTSALEDIEFATRSIKSILQQFADDRLWIVATTLGAAAKRALEAGGVVDDEFVEWAGKAVQLLASGPGQSLNGEFRSAVDVLAAWLPKASAEPREVGLRSPDQPDLHGPLEDAGAGDRPRFRLRGRGRAVEE